MWIYMKLIRVQDLIAVLVILYVAMNSLSENLLDQEFIDLPPLPELRLQKFSLRASGQQQSRYAAPYALRTSILRMFRDHQVNRPNQTVLATSMRWCAAVEFASNMDFSR